MDAEQLSSRLTAIASPQRMRIIAAVAAETTHVSELARRVGMSRALLYMHLQRLEEAGFVSGRFDLSDDGKALKLFEIVPFAIEIDLATIVAAVQQETPTKEREN
ncbi:MAG: winged helix-turn-helix domain-containing protein [Pseudolysinimonas sp.]|uniref:ArsR/SmtB family transcription factor n=1 Tax=Pseudolysinimonas sp. TaxID=2680009 RepID=UPI0032637FF0